MSTPSVPRMSNVGILRATMATALVAISVVGCGGTTASQRASSPTATASTTASPQTSPSVTWEGLDSALVKLAPETSMLAAEIKSGECSSVHGLASDRKLAIASTFKLFVLGELARQIGAGEASWDEQLAVRDEWKSLAVPRGIIQDETAGTEHTLWYFADQMISISDNTATDHLIHRLGRRQVEANLPAMGMTDPAPNVPLPLTRDMAVLKAKKNVALMQSYLAADASGRRTLLDGTVASMQVTTEDMGDGTTPRYIDELEWFASNSDLCAAMASLLATGSKPGMSPLMDALSISTADEVVDRRIWTYVGFKGGSEPGVLNLTWLLHRADNRWFVLSMTLDDPESAASNGEAAIILTRGALKILAQVP